MRKVVLAFLFALLIFIVPTKVIAEEKDYTIDKLNTVAKITEKGDVEVQEEITYTFNGSFNGVYRNLFKNKTNGYVISRVSMKDKNDNVTSISPSNNSKNNTYEIIESDNNTQIKVFSKSNNEKKTLILNYTIQGAANRYKEFGELYWNFYKVENGKSIKDVNIDLSLKNLKFDLNKFKYWIYVDGGEFKTNYDNSSINIKGSNLTSNLGVKIYFQPEFLKIDEKIYKENNEENMKNSSEDIDLKESKKSNKEDFGFVLMGVIVALCASSIIFFHNRSKKKFKEALQKYRGNFKFFEGEILRTKPEDIPPVLVNLLYHEKYISNSTIPSTLFYLCKKGFYTLEKDKSLRLKASSENEEEDLCFSRNNNIESLNYYHLKYFVEWMQDYEKDGLLTLRYIKEKVNSRGGALEFKKCYSEWKKIIKEEGERLNFYITIKGKQVLSNEAYNEKIKWDAYKKYILDYLSNYEEYTDEVDNEDILIYASALEIDNTYLEKFHERLNDLYCNSRDSNYYYMYNDYSYYLMNLYLWDSIDDNIYINTKNNDNNDSSGDGGFGGFSGGGDFSGGGGGDSGAF
ncbi:DUF2207 domain-containing protein [Clostridium scatologenes]|uniref:DUF2207 domain-containing protein n=1 Tax=Clostridium scatologenes TaxID=1548 RepID=A0A0E3JZL5_CLOSL|nr:DUF2207 domain-containing protein [Clostridium scatologenes]AKA68420.1 hypothetical protein CSCA_1295 [Clostridium scatologenes]